jgi:hypothetical protein
MPRRNAPSAPAAPARVLTVDEARVRIVERLDDYRAQAQARWDAAVARFRDETAINPLSAISCNGKPVAEAAGAWLAWVQAGQAFDREPEGCTADPASFAFFAARLGSVEAWLADQKDSIFRDSQSFNQSTCGFDNAIEGNKRAGRSTALAIIGYWLAAARAQLDASAAADARRAETAAATAERADALAFANAF